MLKTRAPALVLLLAGLWCCGVRAAERPANQATAEVVVVNGFVVEIRVTHGGNGYLEPPPVLILGLGTNAHAVASVVNGKVDRITVVDAGSGYTADTRVEIGPSAYPDLAGIQLYAGIEFVGKIGSQIALQYAPSLEEPSRWFHLDIVTQAVNPQVFFDPANQGRRFYRVLPVPDNPKATQLAWVPPATFWMGSPPEEPGREVDEQQHEVTLTEGYWIGRHEVTQGEFMSVLWGNPSQFTSDPNRPVERITWQEATNYCAALSVRERDAGHLPAGYVYRLPTEAEWEHAARAGSLTPYFFGDTSWMLNTYAWYVANSAGMTHLAATKSANPLGLADLYGNVAEWCWDWHAPFYREPVQNPAGPPTGSLRVVRGGSWSASAEDNRSASRDARAPEGRYNDVGFRVVVARGVVGVPTNPNPARLVWVPSGSFMMGSLPSEKDRNSGEVQHRVTISKDFYIGKYEVTVAEYTAVTGEGSLHDPNMAMNFSWDQANSYCVRLTQQEEDAGRLPPGYVYRLPTEAEWEYAARAGTTTRYSFGNDMDYTELPKYAWFGSNTPYPDGWRNVRVGQKLPNPLGLHDIYGSRPEWCSDYYGPYPTNEVVNPQGPASGEGRVNRGGGFYASAYTCRSASRAYELLTSNYPGLRVVLGLR